MDTHDLNIAIARQLKAVNDDAGAFIASILSDDISREDQIAFGHRLVDVAGLIRQRALKSSGMVIEGGVFNDSDDPGPRDGSSESPPTTEGR